MTLQRQSSLIVDGTVLTQLNSHINDTSDAHAGSAITFTPTGTGAVASTVQAKLRETVSVTDFGAAGDGSTDDTAYLQAALDTGKDVYLVQGKTYRYTTTLTVSTNHQRIYGPGILAPDGAIDGVTVSATGNVLDLTFNAPNQTAGYAVKCDNCHRCKIAKLNLIDAFGGLYVEESNTVVVDFMWASLRGPGIKWYGNDDKRSDVLQINFALIDPGNTEYGMDWDGNCHSLEVKYLGVVGGKGMVIRNTDGSTTYPAIGRIGQIEVDYSTTHAIDIQAGLDYDFVMPYVLGATGDGIRVGAAINNYEVRITGGKSVGNTGYGINALGGIVLTSGNVTLYSNTAGNYNGNVYNMAPRYAIDDTFYLTTSSGNPLITFDTIDYETYDRSNNTKASYIGGNVIISWDATRITAGVPSLMKNYTVAGLPAVHIAGDTAFATNGRKAGEGGGAGTGVLVFSDGTNWIACDTGATVAA